MPSETVHSHTDARKFGDVAASVGADGVGTIRLSRPERLNAVTGRTFLELEGAARWLGARASCRAVILTGEGRSFCAGLDLGLGLSPEAATGQDAAPWETLTDPIERDTEALRAGVAAILALREIPQPVIAAVKGHAVGAGFALAAAADIRVCSPDATFNAVFVRIGVTAGDLGLSWFLPRIIGNPRAAELFLTGGVLDAREALELGLVTHVDQDPHAIAHDLAAQVARNPRYGVSATKQLLNASPTAGLRDHLEAEARAQIIGLATHAHQSVLAARTR